MRNMLIKAGFFLTVLSFGFFIGCTEDEPTTDGNAPVASFQYKIDTTNFLMVTFENYSSDATGYSWDFGDGNSSTDEAPVHTYEASGTYKVVLTASNDAGESATQEKDITITDPNEAAAMLTGGSSKTWILQREGVALGIGENIADVAWWSFGGVTPLYDRPCILDDTYTFNSDGSFVNNTGGTFFMDSEANGGWNDAINGGEGCTDDSNSDAFTTSSGGSYAALSGNAGGPYSFSFDASANSLTLNGEGVYIGLPAKSNAGDLGPDGTLAASLNYTVRLAEGSVADTMQLAMEITGGGGYWNFWLVSYHNEADMPDIPAAPSNVNVTFSVDMNDYTGSFTNVYLSGSFNSWSGDADPLTESSETAGVYEITKALAAGSSFEYKFQVDGWTDQDMFTADDACAITSDDTNWNRGIETGTQDLVLGTVCFQSCGTCGQLAPTTMGHTFADAAGADLLSLIGGASTITLGVDDPADAAAAKVGKLDRVAGTNYQEAIISMDPQANFSLENMNTISIDIYVPSSNDFSGSLANYFVIGLGDQTETPPNWWEDHGQWETSDLETDKWHTLTFDLTAPASGANTGDLTQRVDLDMIFVGFGGGNHGEAGTCYIRNLELKQVD